MRQLLTIGLAVLTAACSSTAYNSFDTATTSYGACDTGAASMEADNARTAGEIDGASCAWMASWDQKSVAFACDNQGPCMDCVSEEYAIGFYSTCSK